MRYDSRPKPETGLRNAMAATLRAFGWEVIRIWQGAFSEKGVSDLIFMRHARVLFLEAKTPTGEQRKDQVDFQAKIEAKGGIYLIADRIEDVQDFCRRYDRWCGLGRDDVIDKEFRAFLENEPIKKNAGDGWQKLRARALGKRRRK